jgi:hypothetical protein
LIIFENSFVILVYHYVAGTMCPWESTKTFWITYSSCLHLMNAKILWCSQFLVHWWITSYHYLILHLWTCRCGFRMMLNLPIISWRSRCWVAHDIQMLIMFMMLDLLMFMHSWTDRNSQCILKKTTLFMKFKMNISQWTLETKMH